MSRYRRLNDLLELLAADGQLTVERAARALGVSAAAVRRRLHHPALTGATNALNTAAELAGRQNIKIVVTGGVARPQSYELTGPLATGVLDQVALDVVILGVDGIDAEAGATAHHEGEASINRMMTLRAHRVIVAADSSQAGRRAFPPICAADEVDVLVTDAGISAGQSARLAAAGIHVVLA